MLCCILLLIYWHLTHYSGWVGEWLTGWLIDWSTDWVRRTHTHAHTRTHPWLNSLPWWIPAQWSAARSGTAIAAIGKISQQKWSPSRIDWPLTMHTLACPYPMWTHTSVTHSKTHHTLTMRARGPHISHVLVPTIIIIVDQLRLNTKSPITMRTMDIHLRSSLLVWFYFS